MMTNSNKMDNNMAAIVSTIMILLGFVQGSILTKLIQQDERRKVEEKLEEAIELKFQADLRIDELEEELEREKQSKNELLNSLNLLVTKHTYLPPPDRPLKRSRVASEYSDDEDFECPTSPDVKLSSMD